MKTVYVCEICNRHYDTESWPVSCEQCHARSFRLKDERTESERIKKTVAAYLSLMTQAHEIATQWVQAQNAGYNRATATRIDIEHGLVYFNAQPVTSGIGLNGCSFPIKYLYDPAGLKEAALAQKKEYDDKRAALFARLKELETPTDNGNEIAELKSRIATQTYGNPEGFPYQHLLCGDFIPTLWFNHA